MRACEAEACEMCHVHPGKRLGFLASINAFIPSQHRCIASVE
jgi:hypothetical protein